MTIEKKCKVCGHEWTPMYLRKPKVCPKCKSYKWETGTNNRERNK